MFSKNNKSGTIKEIKIPFFLNQRFIQLFIQFYVFLKELYVYFYVILFSKFLELHTKIQESQVCTIKGRALFYSFLIFHSKDTLIFFLSAIIL